MKPCEFCEREMPKRKGRFCSQICRDAAEAAAIQGPELNNESQLIDWIRLGEWRYRGACQPIDGNVGSCGRMKKRHLNP